MNFSIAFPWLRNSGRAGYPCLVLLYRTWAFAPGLSLPYPSIRLTTPQTPRPAPIATTRVCRTVIDWLKNSIYYFRQTADLMNICDSKRKAAWHIFGAARFLRFWLLLSFSIKSAFWNHMIDGGYFVSVIRITCSGSARTGGRVYRLLLIKASFLILVPVRSHPLHKGQILPWWAAAVRVSGSVLCQTRFSCRNPKVPCNAYVW